MEHGNHTLQLMNRTFRFRVFPRFEKDPDIIGIHALALCSPLTQFILRRPIESTIVRR